MVDISRVVSWDIETAGKDLGWALQPWRKPAIKPDADTWITSQAYIAPHKQIQRAQWLPTWDQMMEVLLIAKSTDAALVGWNLTFDIAWLLSYFEPEQNRLLHETLADITILDGLLLYKRWDRHWKHYRREEQRAGWQETSYSLKAAVAELMPEYAGYEADVEYHIPVTAPKDDPRVQKLLEYNLRDVAFTARLCRTFYEDLPEPEQQAAVTEGSIIPMVAQSWVDGIKIDKDPLVALLQETMPKKKALEAELGVPASVLGSPKQLGELLYDRWGLPVLKRGKTGPSTDKTTLTYLSDRDERVGKILEWRKLNTRINKFLKGPAESVPYCGDWRTHPGPKIRGTYTGRMTYSAASVGFEQKGNREVKRFLPTGIAIHQWESLQSVRSLIVPPDGYYLAEFDFSGQELRLMADLSADLRMLEIFQKGLDGHSLMACRIYGEDYNEFTELVAAGHRGAVQQRKIGKLANFSLQYRTGFRKFRDIARVQGGVSLTEDQSRQVINAYRATYPGVVDFWKLSVQKAMANFEARTMGHSRVMLSGWGTDEDWKLEQSAINFPIQGTGADQKTLALSRLRRFLIIYKVKFAWDLHDGLFFYVPKANAEWTCAEIQRIMNETDYKAAWGWDHILDYPVDCMLGTSWGDLQPLGGG